MVGKIGQEMLTAGRYGANTYGIRLTSGVDAIIMICICAARDEFRED